MLEELHIKNIALIDTLDIDFQKGFTVLSGETGAGKSILIGALSFVLGAKPSVEQLRSGCSEAQVSAVFSLDSSRETVSNSACDKEESSREAVPNSARIKLDDTRQWLLSHDIQVEDDRVLIRRVLKSTGKNAAWICGTAVTRTELVQFCSFLVDIHGQHDHQSLMHPITHRIFLDSYAKITDEVAAFTLLYKELVDKRKAFDTLETYDKDKAEHINYLTFAIEEIEAAKLKANDEEVLKAKETKLSSYEKLFEELKMLNALLSDSVGGISVNLKKAKASADKVASLDSSTNDLRTRLENVFYEACDIEKEYENYTQNLTFDPDELEKVEERLSLIYKLKQKYINSGVATVNDLLSFLEKAKSEVQNATHSSENKAKLKQEVEALEKQVYAKAKAISQKRFTAGSLMAQEVEGVLKTLGMPNTKFAVNMTVKEDNDIIQKCGPYGIDDIEFLIAANPGSPLLPLSRIASGGELSRVMLALKTVLCDTDTIDTLIFDEIDTGIGGEVAVAVGAHIKRLSKQKQILCITHLASIAVYADNQIKIQKLVTNGVTSTTVLALNETQRIAEIARMLSGDSSTVQSLEHARSMLEKYGGM